MTTDTMKKIDASRFFAILLIGTCGAVAGCGLKGNLYIQGESGAAVETAVELPAESGTGPQMEVMSVEEEAEPEPAAEPEEAEESEVTIDAETSDDESAGDAKSGDLPETTTE
jgi:predicted small lipoprotein YifL